MKCSAATLCSCNLISPTQHRCIFFPGPITTKRLGIEVTVATNSPLIGGKSDSCKMQGQKMTARASRRAAIDFVSVAITGPA